MSLLDNVVSVRGDAPQLFVSRRQSYSNVLAFGSHYKLDAA